MRQSEKLEDMLEGLLRISEEVFTLEHKQLVSIEVPAPLYQLVYVDPPREVGVLLVLRAVVVLVGEQLLLLAPQPVFLRFYSLFETQVLPGFSEFVIVVRVGPI